MGVRLYNPTVGRFLQQDPVVGGASNRYEYGLGDPVRRSDLTGKQVTVPDCWLDVLAPIKLTTGYGPVIKGVGVAWCDTSVALVLVTIALWKIGIRGAPTLLATTPWQFILQPGRRHYFVVFYPCKAPYGTRTTYQTVALGVALGFGLISHPTVVFSTLRTHYCST
jgi:hypothetical protein